MRVAWRDEAGEPAWRRLASELRGAERVDSTSEADMPEADVTFERVDDAEGPEAYRLRIDDDGAHVWASTPKGLAYGATTLAQWLRVAGAGPMTEIPGVDISDEPDLAIRGFLLDVSRNRIPTMNELERLVERLAALKFNQLQLYLEHSFAYEGHETVWRDFDPLTPEEIRTVASWCAERHIDLVPNQNSFGHLHRWLVHEPYRRLAECPDGIEHPFSPDPEPFGLCPIDPGSLAFLRELYSQLLPCFPGGTGSSALFNVGLDETLDLGLGRSREACERLGKHRVYLDFLKAVRGLAAEHGRRILFWGDVVLEQPDSLDDIQGDIPADAVALIWGYEADHPWDALCRQFAEARAQGGPEFWVCPGTSSWNSFTGRARNALDNTRRAAVAAREHRADGYLLCDWGDHGHLQPPSVSLPGLVAGADAAWGTGWSAASNTDHELSVDELAVRLDLHVLGTQGPEGLGRALVELGDVHRLAGTPSGKDTVMNGSSLFFQLLFADKPFEQRRADGMTPDGLAAVRARLAELRPAGDDQVSRELNWSARMLDLGADLGEVRFAAGVDVPLEALPNKERRRLWSRLDELLDALGPLWTARSRPGGLETSRTRWRRALAGLSTPEPRRREGR